MHVVVDGSNLATEGRTLPSLKQLIDGVLDFRDENPDAEVVVVVDATFGHRIDDAERPLFEDAIVHQEIVSPPAGAIGRGDAFVLRIAEKVGATVLSNDSFQEFHAEHEWLFEPGRLIGGKPVPGIGWIFTPRTPVRGPRSREATQEAKRKQRKSAAASEAAPLLTGAELLEKGKAALDKLPKGRREKQKKDEPKGREPKKDEARRSEAPAAPDTEAASGRRRKRRSRGPVEDAIALATVEAVVPGADADDEDGGGGKRRKRRRKAAAAPAEPVNEPGVFLELVAAFRPGDLVEGEVEQFSSHGAFVTVRGTRCYIPLSLMADPAPRAAREVLKRGEVRTFVLRAFDAARRGVELALPGTPLPVGPVAEETAAAAVGTEAPEADDAGTSPKPRRAKKAAARSAEVAPAPVPADEDAEPAPSRPRRAKKAAPVEAAPAEAPTRGRPQTASAGPVAAEPVVDDAAGAAPAPPAPRRRARKAAGAVEPVEQIAVPAEPAVEPAAAPAAPRRRVRKAAATVEPAAPAEAPIPAEAPAPVRSRARKAATETTSGATVASTRPSRARKAAAGPTPEAPPASEPEVPRTRRKAAVPSEAALLGVPESAPPAAASAPRSRARKAAGPADAAPAAAAAEMTPRPRGSRKAKTGIEQPAATLAEAATDAAPATSVRKRAAKKAAPPAPAPADDPEAPPAPVKARAKRAPAKKAPPA